MKIISLDIGDKRIGVATCDELGVSVHGVTVIERTNRDQDLQEIQKLVETHQAEMLVVGMPLDDQNNVSKQGEKILRLVNRLKSKLKIPVETQDERYSSREAAEILIEREGSKNHKIDQVAASIILQRFLDEQKGSNKK
ncbi:Holliday junction resolvase RuvX [Bdellovibrionota bacterium]